MVDGLAPFYSPGTNRAIVMSRYASAYCVSLIRSASSTYHTHASGSGMQQTAPSSHTFPRTCHILAEQCLCPSNPSSPNITFQSAASDSKPLNPKPTFRSPKAVVFRKRRFEAATVRFAFRIARTLQVGFSQVI